MISLTIDGIPVTVYPGTTVLEAAQQLGIWIPTLCHHEAVTPYGGCRLCVVEVTRDGVTKTVSSCCYEAAEGIAVQTNTDIIQDIRKFIIGLLLCEAPDAPAIRELAEQLNASRPERFAVRNELCIACGLCVRACREIVGASAIDFAGRGYERTAASPFFERSDECIGCGTCADICPTGAICCNDIPEGEKTTVAGRTVSGPARIVDRWKVDLPLKRCSICGEPFAPEFQLEHIRESAALPDDFFDTCLHCRTT
jgi:NADH dehydrogenase/NADH:ubiquinone oxidoreductase subunit G